MAGVFAFILLSFFLADRALAFDLWAGREHPAVDYLSITAGAEAHYAMPAGYGSVSFPSPFYYLYEVDIAASEKVPLLSRLGWASTLTTELAPALIKEVAENTYSSAYAELRLPFTTNLLSHETSWYLQYRYSGHVTAATADSGVSYEGKMYTGDVGFGSTAHYAALAINTPVTKGDSPDSLSRFGIYYQQETRLRNTDTTAGSVLLPVKEHQGGLFFDITKPVFAKGIIINIHARGGIGYRQVLDNVYSYISSDFSDTVAILYTNIGGSAAYRLNLGKSAGLKAFVSYEYNGIIVLAVERSVFSNQEPHIASGGISFNYLF